MRVQLFGPVLAGLALLAACGGAPTATSPSGAGAASAPKAATPALTPEREVPHAGQPHLLFRTH